jgi:hypothetical protein
MDLSLRMAILCAKWSLPREDPRLPLVAAGRRGNRVIEISFVSPLSYFCSSRGRLIFGADMYIIPGVDLKVNCECSSSSHGIIVDANLGVHNNLTPRLGSENISRRDLQRPETVAFIPGANPRVQRHI